MAEDTNIMRIKKPMFHPRFGLCIDWETTGSDWENPLGSIVKYQGISFGAAIFETDTFEIVESIYREVQFDDSKYQWTKEAEKIHGISQEYLKENGISREDAAADIYEMIIKFIGPTDKIMFLGHNCQFDIDFTNQLVTDVGLPKLNLHHVKLDTSALGFITLGLYKSDHLFQRMGFSRPEKHNALDDVKMTLTTCQIINSIMKVEASKYLGEFEWLN